jgi:hypothetical protein
VLVQSVAKQRLPAAASDIAPQATEMLVQIGRAGRKGQRAAAVVMLRDYDLHLMHSLKHSAGADLSGVRRVLDLLFERFAAAADGGAEGHAATTGDGKRSRTRKGKAKVSEKAAGADAPAKAAAGPRRGKGAGKRGAVKALANGSAEVAAAQEPAADATAGNEVSALDASAECKPLARRSVRKRKPVCQTADLGSGDDDAETSGADDAYAASDADASDIEDAPSQPKRRAAAPRAAASRRRADLDPDALPPGVAPAAAAKQGSLEQAAAEGQPGAAVTEPHSGEPGAELAAAPGQPAHNTEAILVRFACVSTCLP